MARYLSDEDLKSVTPAEEAYSSPIPTQIVSNGEYHPVPQTREQRAVEAGIKQLAADLSRKHGQDRRRFLASSAGMAAAFLALNDVFGPVFGVSRAEAQTPGVADERARSLARQMIIDCQTHFVRDDYKHDRILGLARFAKKNWNPALASENTLWRFKFENFVKEIFVDSDTKVALLTGAPVDDPEWEFLSNDQIVAARSAINKIAGSRRLLAHSIIAPKRPDFLAEVDRSIATLKPDAWKAYTIGDPLAMSKVQSYWRLDDEKLMYPFYEKIVKAGITNLCIHKGLMPANYQTSWPEAWQYATVWDLAKAAKDWPKINFIIYHSAMRPFLELPDKAFAEFESTGRIEWASDLAEMPAKHGVKNVYAELGTCFANSAVTNPKLCAALVGTLIKGLGADHVIWGTDAVWYGSPQWQIEAMRRLEIPEDMQKKYGFRPLGDATGKVKTAIFSGNPGRLFKVQAKTALGPITNDNIAAIRAEYLAAGGVRSNTRYGYIAKETAS